MKQYLFIPGGFMVGNFIGFTSSAVAPGLFAVLLVGIALTAFGFYFMGKLNAE